MPKSFKLLSHRRHPRHIRQHGSGFLLIRVDNKIFWKILMRIPKIIKESTIDWVSEVNRILHPILNVPVHLTPFYKLSDLLLLVMVDFFIPKIWSTTLFLMCLKLPKKTVMKAPQSLVNTITPLLHCFTDL